MIDSFEACHNKENDSVQILFSYHGLLFTEFFGKTKFIKMQFTDESEYVFLYKENSSFVFVHLTESCYLELHDYLFHNSLIS